MKRFSSDDIKKAKEAFVANYLDESDYDEPDCQVPALDDGEWSAEGWGDDEEASAGSCGEDAPMRVQARKFARTIGGYGIVYRTVKQDELFQIDFEGEAVMEAQDLHCSHIKMSVVFDDDCSYAQFLGLPNLHVPVVKLFEALEAVNEVNRKYSDIACTIDDDLDVLFTSTQRYLPGDESYVDRCFLCMACMVNIIDEAYSLLARAIQD